MKTVKLIAPYKGLKVGTVIDREAELADWLCSRQYAVPCAAAVVAVAPPAAPVKRSRR